MDKVQRIKKSLRKLNKVHKRLEKARAERIWIENNPQIHILNYPFYKLIKWFKENQKEGE